MTAAGDDRGHETRADDPSETALSARQSRVPLAIRRLRAGTESRLPDWLPTQDRVRRRAERVGRRVKQVVFGDDAGLFVFLVALAAFVAVWRVTVTINDSYTVVNGLVALADGHLYVTEVPYGGRIESPGMVRVDGRAYPRNVAHIAWALPFVWLFRGVALVADPRIALVAGWSLLLLAVCAVGGRLAGRARQGRVVGSVVCLGAFAANATVATPLPDPWLALVALQASTMVMGGLLCVLLYRLLARMHGRRVGLAAGLATGLASPVLFWASVSKRHVATATLVVAALYLFYRGRVAERSDASVGASGKGRPASREDEPSEPPVGASADRWRPSATHFRLLAYVPGGLAAWLHAAEGLVLLLALVAVDLLTARRTSARTLAAILAVVLVSLLPFFATNHLIAGDAFAPPRALPDYDTGGQPGLLGEATAGDSGGSSGSGGGSGGGGGSPGGEGTPREAAGAGGDGSGATTEGGGGGTGIEVDPVSVVPDAVLDALTVFVYLRRGAEAVVDRPGVLVHAFVRSGYVEYGSRWATGLANNLSFVESLPVAGALAAAPGLVHQGVRRGRSDPVVATDLLAVVVALLVTLLYIDRFPVHAMITVRYLFPLFPLAVYGVARAPWVRRALAERGRLLAWTYAAVVLVGGQILAATIVLVDATPDEAMQGAALLALAVAGALALWSVSSALGRRDDRMGALLLGVAGGVATTTMLVISYYYFGSDFALPIVPIS